MTRILAGVLAAAALGGAPREAPQQTLRVAIILNSANELKDLSSDQLRKIFLLERTFWGDGKPIKVLAQEADGSRARALVLEKVYRMDEKKYRKYWQLKIFKGEVSSAPSERTEEQLAREVSQEASAVGYIDLAAFEKLPAEVKGKIRALQIDGKAPSDADYPLTSPEPD